MIPVMEKLAGHSQVRELRRQLEATPRLRWMVYAVFFIFGSYLILLLDDSRVALWEDYRQVAARAAKLESLREIDPAEFAAFLESEQAMNAAVRKRFWMASSRGLAGAEFQSWLRFLASESKLGKLRINLGEVRPVESVDAPLWRVEAELTGEITPSDVRTLLGMLAESERAVSVENLSFSPARGDRLSLQLAADFLIERSSSGSQNR